jgi:hypothetical protein
VADIVSWNYYVDARAPAGIGTELNPINYEQLRNYLNPLRGTACDIVMQDLDVFNIKGVIDIIENGIVFDIGRSFNGTIKFQSWDIQRNGLWIIDMAGMDVDEITLVGNSFGNYIYNMIIQDFIFTKKA